MIKLGDNNVTLKLGNNDVSKVYLGENQIYPSAPATNLVMQRISDTEYLVTGDGGTADLTFTRESDSLVDAKGVQSLPYTFTHTEDEIWSVNGVYAWAVDIPYGGYLEAQNASDLDFNDYMEISLLIDPQSDVGNALSTFFGKVKWDNDNARWAVYSRSSAGGAVAIFSRSGVNEYIFSEGDAPLYNKWYNIKSELDGVNYSISLNDIKVTDTIDLNAIPYTSTHFFRIGRAVHSRSGVDNFVGKVQNYKHGTEVFDMNEGTGTTTTGSEGTILNLLGGATWVII